MSGMVKPKQYDWKDSNLALFGSETERNVKEASAATEEAWEGAGTSVGLQVWRINNFKVEHWPKEDYGKFFSGDSYIVMNTYVNPGEEDFEFDLHFWIGKESTQDEYGTAAYKTVELDTLLKDKPVQHREVMNNESDLFKAYFPSLTYLRGGAQTGFNHVEKRDFEPRLFRFTSSESRRSGGHSHSSRRKETRMTQISLNKANLDSGDVFILETDEVIYQWNGQRCDMNEKNAARQHVIKLREERLGKPKAEVIDDPDTDEDFLSFFSDESPVEDQTAEQDGADGDQESKVLRLSDASGKLQLKSVDGSGVRREMFDSNDVFIVDRKDGACFVWFGNGASREEVKNWCMYAHNYLKSSPNPLKHVRTVKEGKEPQGFFD